MSAGKLHWLDKVLLYTVTDRNISFIGTIGTCYMLRFSNLETCCGHQRHHICRWLDIRVKHKRQEEPLHTIKDNDQRLNSSEMWKCDRKRHHVSLGTVFYIISQCVSIITLQLRILVQYKADIIIIIPYNLFSPRYYWNITNFTLDRHSLTF
jgi:hypothetical protein